MKLCFVNQSNKKKKKFELAALFIKTQIIGSEEVSQQNPNSRTIEKLSIHWYGIEPLSQKGKGLKLKKI